VVQDVILVHATQLGIQGWQTIVKTVWLTALVVVELKGKKFELHWLQVWYALQVWQFSTLQLVQLEVTLSK
jgi:hypothetical protein